jgi:hypothetical protein
MLGSAEAGSLAAACAMPPVYNVACVLYARCWPALLLHLSRNSQSYARRSACRIQRRADRLCQCLCS